jgi:sugar-specific transcriptional regulator TrmB
VTKVNHHQLGKRDLGKEELLKVLKDFGLTDTEAEIYLFLARHESLKGTEIAKLIKKDKAQVYHILKSLQAKGLVESTLESPARFTPVPFERIVESTINSKKDEAAQIERTKDDLLSYWGSISKNKLDLTQEKFVVIEGRHKVYSKIAQMIKETKNQFSTITSVNALVRADQFGLYDAAFKNPLKSKIDFRFLTELSGENLKTMKAILKKTSKKGINFRGRNPDLGLSLFPSMVIRDNEETVFFLAPRNAIPLEENDEMCLWTNCRDLVQAFSVVFEGSWLRATDISTKIEEIETGIPSHHTFLIENPKLAKAKYVTAMQSAKTEVLIVASSENFIDLYKEVSQLKEKTKELKVKVLAPITNENLQVALKLSECCEVRHAHNSYLTKIVIDGKHLFEFKIPLPNHLTEKSNPFKNILYSNDKEYVERTQNLLNDLWNNSQAISSVTLESINRVDALVTDPSPGETLARATRNVEGAVVIQDEKARGKITEKQLLDKMIYAQKASKLELKDVVRTFGTNAQAIVHPPENLNLPDLLFHILHNEKRSTYGAEDAMIIHLWLKTPTGNYAYVPVAFVTDCSEAIDFWKHFLAGMPAAQNAQLLKKDELQVQVHGNTLFVGWTTPILLLQKIKLPPSAILIEGRGNIKAGAMNVVPLSGYTMKTEFNGCEGFVTFLNPISNYSGPGTDGYLGRDTIMEFYPPTLSAENAKLP